MARKGTGKRKRPSNRPPSQSGWSRSNLATPLTSKATLVVSYSRGRSTSLRRRTQPGLKA
jgi:hypothetical protein